jgi:amidase
VFVGDLHAAMGDGELTATGCEFAGSVRLRIDLIKSQPIPGPRLRFDRCWATLATSRDFDQACRSAVNAMHEWIRSERGLDDDAAALVIGMAGGVGISQVVNPSGVTVKVVVDWTAVSIQ